MSDRIYNPRKPQSCILFLSTQCNLRCKMCSLWKRDPNFQPIPLQQWESFFSSLKSFLDKPINVGLTGGEVFLDEKIFALIKIIDKFGFNVFAVSNGTPINESLAEKIIESNLKSITLSLDSLNVSTHDYLRGKEGTFAKVMNAIRYLRNFSKDLSINIMTIIMGKNIDDIIPLVHWVQDNNNLNHIHFQVIAQDFAETSDEYWYSKERYKELWPQDINRVCAVCDSLKSLKEKGFKINNPHSQFEIFKDYFKDPKNCTRKYGICNVIDYGLDIHPGGRIFLCPVFGQPIGDVYQDIKEVYYSTKTQEIRRQISLCNRNCHNFVNCSYEE